MDLWNQKWESEVVSQRSTVGGNKYGKSQKPATVHQERESLLCTSAVANRHPLQLSAASEWERRCSRHLSGRGGTAGMRGRVKK